MYLPIYPGVPAGEDIVRCETPHSQELLSGWTNLLIPTVAIVVHDSRQGYRIYRTHRHTRSLKFVAGNLAHRPLPFQGGREVVSEVLRRSPPPTRRGTDLDPLVINQVPDFFVSGHIHKAAAANYRNITLIAGSCWQSKTTFQEKVGHNPEPSRVPIVNLKTREVKILKFGK